MEKQVLLRVYKCSIALIHLKLEICNSLVCPPSFTTSMQGHVTDKCPTEFCEKKMTGRHGGTKKDQPHHECKVDTGKKTL